MAYDLIVLNWKNLRLSVKFEGGRLKVAALRFLVKAGVVYIVRVDALIGECLLPIVYGSFEGRVLRSKLDLDGLVRHESVLIGGC